MYRASGALFNTMETDLGVASSAAQEARHGVRPVAQLPGGVFNPLLRGRGDVPRQRRVVQHDGNRSRREAAGLRYVSHGDHFDLSAHSGGTSKESCSRNPRVSHTPKATPATTQIEPTILAGWLRFHHNPRQIKNPAKGETKFITFFCSALRK